MQTRCQHRFRLIAQLGDDEPILVDTLETRDSPDEQLNIAQARFGSRWTVWLDRIPAVHPFRRPLYNRQQDRVVTRLHSWEGASTIAPLVHATP